MALGALLLEIGVAIVLGQYRTNELVRYCPSARYGVRCRPADRRAHVFEGAQAYPDSRKAFRVISIIGAVLLAGTPIGLLMLRLTSSL